MLIKKQFEFYILSVKLFHHPIEILYLFGPELPVDSGFLFLGAL